MSPIGQPERVTQERVIALFRDELGYRFLGDWRDREYNTNIEEGLLTDYLARNGYTDVQIKGALEGLRRAADNHARGLYENNKAVYSLLRYGVKVQATAGEHHANVQLINWGKPEQNDFAIAKEVTLAGGHERRPDIVLYVNGIAVGVLELKNSRKSIGGGIIWHTQGSGKSIVMVMLAKWILENNPRARIAIVTDRDELDRQIEGVFKDAGDGIYRTDSGLDLMRQLGQARPRLLCSLVHKFGPRGDRKTEEQFNQFVRELENGPSRTVGEVFVFVDECHRTQSGRLHRVMKAMMPNAVTRCLWHPASTRRASISPCSRRRPSRAGARLLRHTTRRPATYPWRRQAATARPTGSSSTTRTRNC